MTDGTHRTELKRCEKSLSAFIEKKRPPAHLRDQVDLAYRIKGQTVDIYEIRPKFQDKSVKAESAVARATFVATKTVWKIFWMRADLKWHGYEPAMYVKRIEEFIKVVEEDEYSCFWG